MERALNKILDVLYDYHNGARVDFGDVREYIRGYLYAIEESGEITRREMSMLLRAYDRMAEIEMMNVVTD